MPRRVPLRLARLLAVAGACLLLPAALAEAQPINDSSSTPTPITALSWTSLSSPEQIVVQASDWGDASIGPEDSNPLPTCTGSTGFRSMWYSLVVPEASVLRVTVISTDPVRYQPVVNIIDQTDYQEVGCGLANDVRQGATANATAYVTPTANNVPYLIRVAEVNDNSPSGGLPMLTLQVAAQDVTPPHIQVDFPSGKVPPHVSQTYDASATTDFGSGVNPDSAHWEFHDTDALKHTVIARRTGLQANYTWKTPGIHEVDFTVSDRAKNEATYRFYTLVQDSTRPDVSFSLRPPEPGARRLRVVVRSSESVKVRLLVTQTGRKKPLLQRFVSFWGSGSHARAIPLLGGVGRGLLVISGIARDLAGNATELPQCTVNPVTGRGRCVTP